MFEALDLIKSGMEFTLRTMKRIQGGHHESVQKCPISSWLFNILPLSLHLHCDCWPADPSFSTKKLEPHSVTEWTYVWVNEFRYMFAAKWSLSPSPFFQTPSSDIIKGRVPINKGSSVLNSIGCLRDRFAASSLLFDSMVLYKWQSKSVEDLYKCIEQDVSAIGPTLSGTTPYSLFSRAFYGGLLYVNARWI